MGDLADLPSFNDAYPVDQTSIDGFQADGHTVLRGLATRDELAAVAPAICSLALERAFDKRPLDERDTYGKAFLQSFNLWRVDPVVARFVLAPRFAAVAAALLGVEGVRVYHDQALVKEAGGGPTPWHQDQYYWPFDTEATITLWMPLLDLRAEVGSMTFVSGSHRVAELRGPGISDESQRSFARQLDELGLATATHGALAAGDATFHAGWTVHSAGGNPTDEMRPVLTVIYVADGARVARDLTEAQEFDRKVWLGGREPGEPVDHEMNPRVWPVSTGSRG
jgi:ectoine hydroxylase-related dioxygenase (phytanoyl-CoA dioxygenase family)